MLPTLTEVIEHYNSGGKTHPNKSNLIRLLNLTQAEKEALEAFLNSLSDFEFVNDERWTED